MEFWAFGQEERWPRVRGASKMSAPLAVISGREARGRSGGREEKRWFGFGRLFFFPLEGGTSRARFLPPLWET